MKNMRKEHVDKSNILTKVNRELSKLPSSYVVCLDCKESKGKANVNIGGTKFQLKIHVFDSDLEDWTHQPSVLFKEFDDSDGTVWWNDSFQSLKNSIEQLIMIKNTED